MRAEAVWALRRESGFAFAQSDDHVGRDVALFWSDRAYAERARKMQFPESKPAEITLFDFLFRWLSGMADDGVLAGVNWTGDLVGFESDPGQLQVEMLDRMRDDMRERYLADLAQATQDDG